jgi:hypothetical protein
MEGAIICGLNVVGVDVSHKMYLCAANRRLANVMQAQAFRRDLALLKPVDVEDYVKAAHLTLPAVVLTSPEKRQRALLQKNNMRGLHIMYHTVLGLPWSAKGLRQRLLETGLKLHIM